MTKKILLLVQVLFSSILLGAQVDTIFYSSSSGRVLNTSLNANYCTHLIRKSDTKFLLINKQYIDKHWEEVSKHYIIKTNDSTYLVTKTAGKNSEQIVRVAQKLNNSFYLLKDYKNKVLLATGTSKLIFPDLKEGIWINYYPSGKKASEEYFSSNQMTGNRNWNENGEEGQSNVFKYAQEMPQFPGGVKLLNQFIQKNIQLPNLTTKHKNGIVYIQMIVMEDGALEDIKVGRGLDAECDAEALRVVRLMPRWQAGQMNNKGVKVFVTFPVVFTYPN